MRMTQSYQLDDNGRALHWGRRYNPDSTITDIAKALRAAVKEEADAGRLVIPGGVKVSVRSDVDTYEGVGYLTITVVGADEVIWDGNPRAYVTTIQPDFAAIDRGEGDPRIPASWLAEGGDIYSDQVPAAWIKSEIRELGRQLRALAESYHHPERRRFAMSVYANDMVDGGGTVLA